MSLVRVPHSLGGNARSRDTPLLSCEIQFKTSRPPKVCHFPHFVSVSGVTLEWIGRGPDLAVIEILQAEIGDTGHVLIGFMAGEAEENLPAIDGRNRSLRLSRGLFGSYGFVSSLARE